MPGYGRPFAVLDVWDVVALLRRGQFSLGDFFPDAQRFAVKRYAIDDDGARRAAQAIGEPLTADERQVDVAAVFGSGRSAEARPVYVPQEPALLDTLKPKDKAGYVAVFEVVAELVHMPAPPAKTPAKKGAKTAPEPARVAGLFDWPWTTVPIGISMDAKGVIKKVELGGEAADRERAAKTLAEFAGQGGKRGDKVPEYKPLKAAKGGEKLAKVMTRLYYRALEGAMLFDKEEHERTWADPTP